MIKREEIENTFERTEYIDRASVLLMVLLDIRELLEDIKEGVDDND